MKKCLVFLLVLSFAFSLTACKGDSSSNSAASNSAGGAPIKLVYFSNINVDTGGYDVNDNPYIKYVEKENNIDLQLINDSTTNYDQKLYTVMASGNLPDYCVVNYMKDLQMFASQGLLMPIDSYLSKYPDFTKKYKPVSWEMAKYNGKIYGVPAQRFDPTPMMVFARKDWVNNLGIDPNKAMTIDQWYNMLKDFTVGDPDKNGKNDTFGFTANGSSDATLLSYNVFMDAFNAAKWQVVSGELRPNYILDGYKDWLKFMHKLYAEKILDPEYLTNTGTKSFEKEASGKYGAWEWFWSQIEFGTAGGKRDDVVALKPPLKADGSQSGYLYTAPVRNFVCITKNCKHPEAVIALQNWLTTNEGKIYDFAGLEGLDYTKENGKITFMAGRAGKNEGWRQKTVGTINPVVDSVIQPLLEASYGSLAMQHFNLAMNSGTFDDIGMVAPYNAELADYNLDSIVTSFRDKAIIGQVDIDKQWDAYVKQWRQAGGDKFIQFYTKWYNDTYKKK